MEEVEILTGVRPSADLTVANFIGAVKPIIDMQEKGLHPYLFVADLHGLTDTDPKIVKQYTNEVVADYIALGVSPSKTTMYKQSDIANEVLSLTTLLARHVSVAELLRIPTLKDKLTMHARPETANALLFLYPVLMAADILIQRTKKVPVGEDQLPHIEMTRLLARRFNSTYGTVFPLPTAYTLKSVRISSLHGEGKMSKSSPSGALFLTDSPDIIAKKIKAAATATEKVMTDALKSHITIAKELTDDTQEIAQIDTLISDHLSGKQVMGEFKKIFTEIFVRFATRFQESRSTVDQNMIEHILDNGAHIAREHAQKTLDLVDKALYHS